MHRITLLLLLAIGTLISETNMEVENLPQGTIVTLQGKANRGAARRVQMSDSTGNSLLITLHKNVVEDSLHSIIGIVKNPSKGVTQIKPFYITQGDSILLEPKDTITVPKEYQTSEYNQILYKQYKQTYKKATTRLVVGGGLLTFAIAFHARVMTTSNDITDQPDYSPGLDIDMSGIVSEVAIPFLYAGGIPLTISGFAKLKESKSIEKELEKNRRRLNLDVKVNPLKSEIALVGEF